MRTRVSEKGQVTIPKRLRVELGLRAGMEVDFRVEEGLLIGSRVDAEDPILAVTGVAEGPADVDRYLDEVRGPRE